MTTTLTREALLDKGKARVEEVEIEGYGTVLLRSLSEVQRSKRGAALFDDNGKRVDSKFALRRIHAIIDQVMQDEKTPMFTEADIPELAQMDPMAIDPLYMAIIAFNGEQPKNESDEQSENSNETTA